MHYIGVQFGFNDMSEESQYVGGDGMSAYNTAASGQSQTDAGDAASLANEVAEIAKLNGYATLVSQRVFTQTMARIYSLFGATRQADKARVDRTMIYYFSVHGTSPQTLWGTYEYPICAMSKELRPMEVVGLIGANKLKKFMGRFTQQTIAMYQASPDLQGALAERAARRGLANGQEMFAIDYLGKDGTLSPADAQVRVFSRDAGLHYRASNANSIMEQQRERMMDATPDDARALGNARNTMNFN